MIIVCGKNQKQHINITLGELMHLYEE